MIISSGNGLIPPGNKPLHEPMLIKTTLAIWLHEASMSLTCCWHCCVTSMIFFNLWNYVPLTHGGLVMQYTHIDLSVNIGSGDGLLSIAAPSYYLNWCWLIFTDVLWHSPERNFTRRLHGLNPRHVFRDYTFAIITTFPRDQWVQSSYIWHLLSLTRLWTISIYGSGIQQQPVMGHKSHLYSQGFTFCDSWHRQGEIWSQIHGKKKADTWIHGIRNLFTWFDSTMQV